MRKLLHDNHGESIVEILVSFLMLLILVGAFTAAIRGANAMMTKAGELRKQAFDLELDLQGKLYPVQEGPYPEDDSMPEITEAEAKTYIFSQTDPSGSGSFTIKAQLGRIEVTTDDGATHPFPEYRAEVAP